MLLVDILNPELGARLAEQRKLDAAILERCARRNVVAPSEGCSLWDILAEIAAPTPEVCNRIGYLLTTSRMEARTNGAGRFRYHCT